MRFSTLAMATAVLLAATIVPASAQVTIINGEYTVDDAANTGPQVFDGIIVGSGAVGTLNIFDGRLVRSIGDTLLGRPQVFNLLSGTGIVNVTGNHSRLDVETRLWVGANDTLAPRTGVGFLNITAGGHVRAPEVGLAPSQYPAQGTVTVSGPGSLLEVGTALSLYQRVSPAKNSTVRIETGGTVSVGTTITGNGTPKILLEGGTLSLTDPAALEQPGWVTFNTGSFRFRSNQTLDGAAGFYTNFYGSPPVLAAGRGLAIDGITTLATSLRLDGGSLRTTRIARNPSTGSILLNGGALTLTDDGAVIDAGGDFGPEPLTVGDGTAPAMLLELAGAGDVFLGAVTVAADGVLNFGGESLIVDSLNNGGSVSIADATVDVRAGLLNAGSLSLADAVVEGDVTSPAGGTIDVAGTVLFNGNVTCGAAFYGSGTVVFNGTLSVD
jgi:hypothetical protein